VDAAGEDEHAPSDPVTEQQPAGVAVHRRSRTSRKIREGEFVQDLDATCDAAEPGTENDGKPRRASPGAFLKSGESIGHGGTLRVPIWCTSKRQRLD
jgi:hypothetical protein